MKVKKHSRKHSHISLFSLLIMALMLISIGYASINSVILEISAKVDASAPKTIFITGVQYVSDVDANRANSQIHDFTNTTMQSTVQLSSTNPNSEIVYKVTVYNNSGEEAVLKNAIHIEDYYDNEGIIYEILETGFKQGDTIKVKEKKDIYIKFKYKDSTIASNTTLNLYIKFSIGKPNMLKTVSGNGNFFGSVSRSSIEKISFELGKIPENATQTFDASANQDNSIIGYVTDTDGNGKKEVTFSSDDIIFANPDSSYLFSNLTILTTIEFNNFNTSQVTDMYYMFYNSKFSELDLSNFDTSKVINMAYMFRSCNKLISLDLSNFDTSNIKAMSTMFENCSSLTSLDISNFDISKVTSLDFMFVGCSSLTSLDLSNFNTSQVTSMSQIFNGCSSLTSLDVSKFDTSKVISMSDMFRNCNKLISLDLSNFDTSKVTNMSDMFNDCSSLTSLDLSNFDTSKVTSMSSMFSTCINLTTIYASNTFNIDGVTDSSNMFGGSTNLVGGNGTTYNSSNVDKTYARIDTASTPGYFTKGKEKRFLKVDSNKNFWGLATDGKAEVQKVIFLDSIENAPSSTTDVSELGDGSIVCWADSSTLYIASNEHIYANPDSSGLFQGLGARVSRGDIENLNLLNTSEVTNMSDMFYNCYKLTSIDVSKFDTSKVTDMSGMFYNCRFSELDISNFDTAKVTSMSSMFSACINLTTIYASNTFNIDGVTDSSNMFGGSTKLIGGNGTVFDSNIVDKTYARIDTASAPGYFTKKP